MNATPHERQQPSVTPYDPPEPEALHDRPSRPISPGVHAVLDYVVAATFFGVGLCLMRRHKRAATLAFVNGGLVAGMSMVTDYPGGAFPLLSFRGHRTADILQAALTGLGPVLLGFAGDREAIYFYGQAASEVAVISATDWDAVRTTRP